MATVVVVTNYLDTRGVRVRVRADTVDTGCSARLADTVHTIAICTILCDPTTNSRTELPPARVSRVNKINRMDVRFQRILPMVKHFEYRGDLIDEIGLLLLIHVSSFQISTYEEQIYFLNANLKRDKVLFFRTITVKSSSCF